jgi:hypothetical protein
MSHPHRWQDGTRRGFLKLDNLSPLLFATAVLSHRSDLNARLRSQIVSRVRPFDIHSRSESLDALASALQAVGAPFSPRALTANRWREAVLAASEWLRRGIFVLARNEIKAPEPSLHDLPPIFFAKGSRSLLHRTGVAILNSRKSRPITAQDYWITATKERVASAMQLHGAIVSSYGNLSYSLVTCLAKDFPLILVCDDVLPFMDSEPKARQFQSTYWDLFNPESTLFISSFPPGRLPARADRLAARDHVVAALSSVLMVAEVRPGGNMDAILDVASRRKVKVLGIHQDEARVEKESHSEKIVNKRRSRQSCLQQSNRGVHEPKGVNWPDFVDFGARSSYLIHFTRSCPGPWPGQTMAQYCRSLIDGSATSSHTAFDTLYRILEEKLVRGSSRLTRGSRPVVSLTECMPSEISAVVKWRPGLIRWSFEPYGIAVRKDAISELGARPVVYGTEEVLRKMPEDEKYLFQIRKSDQKDWTAEKEWRLPGDLLLTWIRHEDLVVIVPDPEEAKIIQANFGYNVASAGVGVSQSHPALETDGAYTVADSALRTSNGI